MQHRRVNEILEEMRELKSQIDWMEDDLDELRNRRNDLRAEYEELTRSAGE